MYSFVNFFWLEFNYEVSSLIAETTQCACEPKTGNDVAVRGLASRGNGETRVATSRRMLG